MGRGDPGSPRVPAVGAAPQLDWFWKRTWLCRVIGHDMDVFFRGDATPELYTYLNEGNPSRVGKRGVEEEGKRQLGSDTIAEAGCPPCWALQGVPVVGWKQAYDPPFLRNTVFEIYG